MNSPEGFLCLYNLIIMIRLEFGLDRTISACMIVSWKVFQVVIFHLAYNSASIQHWTTHRMHKDNAELMLNLSHLNLLK